MSVQLYKEKVIRYIPIGYSDGFDGFPRRDKSLNEYVPTMLKEISK